MPRTLAYVTMKSHTFTGLARRRLALGSLTLGSLTLGSPALGSPALGSLTLGSLTLGSLALGSLVLGSLVLGSLALGSCATTGASPASIETEPVIGLHKPGWGPWRPLRPRQNATGRDSSRPERQLHYGDTRKPGYGPPR